MDDHDLSELAKLQEFSIQTFSSLPLPYFTRSQFTSSEAHNIQEAGSSQLHEMAADLCMKNGSNNVPKMVSYSLVYSHFFLKNSIARQTCPAKALELITVMFTNSCNYREDCDLATTCHR